MKKLIILVSLLIFMFGGLAYSVSPDFEVPGILTVKGIMTVEAELHAPAGIKVTGGTIEATDFIGDGSQITNVQATEIATGSVVASDLSTGSVTEAAISDGAVTAAKLTTDSVTSAAIEDGAITGADLDTGINISTTGHVTAGSFSGDGSLLTNIPLATSADQITISVRKGSAGTILKGSPVYVSGYNIGGSYYEVEAADADVAANMPAIGVAGADITNTAASTVVTSGRLTNFDTSTPGWSVGDALYVSTTAGTFQNTKPTGASDGIQKVAQVLRRNVANGVIEVFGAGRTNDVPNAISITEYITAETINATTLYGDGSNLSGVISDTAGYATLSGTASTAASVSSSAAVQSISSQSATALTGAVEISAGNNITVTQTGQLISIEASGGSGDMTAAVYDGAGVTEQLVGLTATQTLTNKTLTTPIISTISNTGTITLPTATDTLVGRTTADTLTNKTLVDASINIVDNADGTKQVSFEASGIPTGQSRTWNVGTGIPQNIQAFTAGGTWTRPAGVGTVYVQVWGAGGGGGTSASNVGGGGGGGGGYSAGLINVTTDVTVIVGTGGAADTAGGLSSFAGATTITGNGGAAGATGATGGAGGAGGTGVNGAVNIPGATGQNGVSANGGSGGMGGGSPFGGSGGGAGEVDGPSVGGNGSVPGGAGGGGGEDAAAIAGGSGANGLVIISY